MKNNRDLILGKVVYILIFYRISDSWLFSLNGYDFYFDHMTGENRESERFSDVKHWALFMLVGDDVTLDLGKKR